MHNLSEIEYTIFCIESIASYLNKDSKAVFNSLKDSGILDNYIVPTYDVLHTQSKEYIVEDIIDVMKNKGVVIR